MSASQRPSETLEASEPKDKNELRRQQLEAFRAERALKRAASLGLKAGETEGTETKAPRARPPQLKLPSQQRDPNKRPVGPLHNTERTLGASRNRTPKASNTGSTTSARPSASGATMTARPSATGSAMTARPSASGGNSMTSRPSVSGSSKAARPLHNGTLKTPRSSQTSHAESPESSQKGIVKKIADSHTHRIFGFESSKEIEMAKEVAEKEAAQEQQALAPTNSLGPGFSDSSDSFSGIKWSIQMEKLRLQQWKVLNSRTQASLEKQEKLADEQFLRAAEAVLSIKQEAYDRRVKNRQELHSQLAQEVLAAQIPRLELYASMKADHEGSLDKTTEAVAAIMQQMPFIDGACCGDAPEEVDAAGLLASLNELRQVLDGYVPRIQKFTPDALNQDGDTAQAKQGFCSTAAATERLAEENAELEQYLTSNADLLTKLEREVLHAESLSVQLLHAQQAC